MKIPERSQWVRALTAHPNEKVLAAIDSGNKTWRVIPKAVPQSGLAIIKFQDGAFHEPFYLGEIPLATAWVRVITSEGREVEGAAQVMADSAALAETLALCDAILAHRLSGWRKIADLVRSGLKMRTDQDMVRKAMLAKTQVDFSLLDAVGDDDEV
ncbi:MAG TPA: phosphonate C-P lyase system protein PhnG [Rhodospirillales bacterium]|nr:phosphonate C-P lyase system protein PhnG [Rhodospirillales bacterium]